MAKGAEAVMVAAGLALAGGVAWWAWSQKHAMGTGKGPAEGPKAPKPPGDGMPKPKADGTPSRPVSANDERVAARLPNFAERCVRLWKEGTGDDGPPGPAQIQLAAAQAWLESGIAIRPWGGGGKTRWRGRGTWERFSARRTTQGLPTTGASSPRTRTRTGRSTRPGFGTTRTRPVPTARSARRGTGRWWTF